MRKILPLLFVASAFIFQSSQAQNSSPYWSLAGNSNATSSSKLGTTNSVDLRLVANNVERMRIVASNGRVGIGTTAPINILTVHGSGGTPSSKWVTGGAPLFVGFGESTSGNADYILSMASNTSYARPVFIPRRARGTLASPAVVQNNDYLASFLASGYDGSNFQNPAAVDFYVDGTPSSGHVPGRISFVTGTAASDRKERLIIKANGNIGIGTSSPLYKLHVDGGTGTGVYGNGDTYGVVGHSGDAGIAVYGTGGGIGVYGDALVGVKGQGSDGVEGISLTGSGGNGVFGSADEGNGVKGTSNSGYGVYGQSSSTYSSDGSTGVYGSGYYGVKGTGTFGVYGTGSSYALYGTTGSSTSGYGVYGYGSLGVYGYGGSYGVYGYGGSYGIYASSGGTYAGYFSGNVYASGTYTGSDRKLKKNITDFTSAIDIINKLQPKTYEYRQDGNYKLMNLPEGTHYGLIAQDLEQVLPNLVKSTKFDVTMSKQVTEKQEPGKAPNATAAQRSEVIDFKAVNYTELIPIMIKAMQEQQQENDDLKARVAKLEELVNKLTTGQNITTVTNAGLSQNTPNPAAGSTRISCTIPAGSHAQLLLTDAAGKMLKSIPVNGSGTVDVNTASLSSGVYNYTLIVDGKTADTKKMLVIR